jgi:hypothetical protein
MENKQLSRRKSPGGIDVLSNPRLNKGTPLKHEKIRIVIAREREMLVRQRAFDLARANEALRSCLDALASVTELDQFVGQVMAVITGQLGAASGGLLLFDARVKKLNGSFKIRSAPGRGTSILVTVA